MVDETVVAQPRKKTTRRIYTGRLYFDAEQNNARLDLIDTHNVFNQSVKILLDRFRHIDMDASKKEFKIILDSCCTPKNFSGKLKPLCKKEGWIGNPCEEGSSTKGAPNLRDKKIFCDELSNFVNGKSLDGLSESEWFYALGEMKKKGRIPSALRGDWERFCGKTYEEIRDIIASEIVGFEDKSYLEQHKSFCKKIDATGLWAVYVIMLTHSGELLVDRETLPCYAGYDKLTLPCMAKALQIYHTDQAAVLNWYYENVAWQKSLKKWCEEHKDFMINDYKFFEEWMKTRGRIRGGKKRLSRFVELEKYIEICFPDDKKRKEAIDLFFEFKGKFADGYTGFSYDDIMEFEINDDVDFSVGSLDMPGFNNAPSRPSLSGESVGDSHFNKR